MAKASIEWLSDETLEATLAVPGAALVVFTAQWCPPCRVLMPRLEQLSSRSESRLRCYLVDIDRDPEAARKYGARGVPTLALFIDGDLEATRVGALDEEQLNTFIASSL